MDELEPFIAKLTALVREAYAAGERDALRRVIAAAGGGSVHAEPNTPGTAHSTSAHLQGTATLAAEATSGKRAKSGTVKEGVLKLILSRPNGIAEAEVNQALAHLNRSSRYMAVRSLVEDGKILKRDGKLFPAAMAEEPGAAAPGRVNPKPEELL